MTHPLARRWAYAATLPAAAAAPIRDAVRRDLAAEIATRGSIAATAAALGVHRSGLYAWCAAWGVPTPCAPVEEATTSLPEKSTAGPGTGA